jgi:thioredoxin 1
MTMGAAQELTTSEFDATVNSGVTLIDFWAEWCGPCRMMTPVIDEIAREFDGRAKVCKINVDNEPDVAMKFDVSSIPTLIVFKDGGISKRFVGVTKKDALVDALQSAVNS